MKSIIKPAQNAAENWSELVTQKDNRIAELEALVKYYEEQFRLAKHRQFGSSSEKSEYDFGQLSLFNEAELFSDNKMAEPELVEIEKHYRQRTRLTTDKLPDDLPVEIVEHELPEAERICPACCGTLHAMGTETRRELVIIPAQVKIREHLRHVYACRSCEKTACSVPIVKAPMPEPVIKGSFASAEAIAQIATQKFIMGVPLYRQEQEWKRQGIALSRQTMSNWLLKVAEDWLEPIYNRLHEQLRSHEVLHADETTLQVLHEPGKTAQSKGYMWLYRTSGDAAQAIVIYEYQPDRKAKRAEEFLQGFKGYLHTDGYEGYHKVNCCEAVREDPLGDKLTASITVVGCWAHLRRKFDEALKSLPAEARENSLALVGKRYCDQFFELERSFADRSPDKRQKERMKTSKPEMEAFFAWANSCNAIPKSPVGKAVYYAKSQRKYLERYILDGRLEISNNRAERSIKPFVIGRKNWLFANTPAGAKSSAILYSLIETAKENGLKPYDYLALLFRELPKCPRESWDDFLPGGCGVPDSCRCPKPKQKGYAWEDDT